jgi:alanine-synthesizing transaminase
VFDGYVAPSILQVEGAKDIAVEFFSLSKSYNMPGWRTNIFGLGKVFLIERSNSAKKSSSGPQGTC